MIDFPALANAAAMDGITRLTTGAIIHQENKVLILRRKPDDFMGGIDELPGGQIESGETIQEAVIREVKEETGLDAISIERYVGCFEYLSKKGVRTRVLNFAVAVAPFTSITLTEHDEYKFITKKELNSTKLSPEAKQILNKFWE